MKLHSITVRGLTNHILPYVPLETFVECGMEDGWISEVSFKCEVFEYFHISLDQGGLFQPGEEPCTSLLLRVHIGPFEEEFSLKVIPSKYIIWWHHCSLHEFHLNTLPIGGFIQTELEHPEDANVIIGK
jgi:hypothetical protein